MCDFEASGIGCVWICCHCGERNANMDCNSCGEIVCPDEPRIKANLMVTGCAKSGTMYTSKLLRTLGADVGHEWFAPGGMVSCFLGVDEYFAPHLAWDGRWVKVSHMDFLYRVHLVREPIACISSLMAWEKKMNAPSMEHYMAFIKRHTSCDSEQDPLEFWTRYWLDWNEHAELACSMTIRVEDLPLIDLPFVHRLAQMANAETVSNEKVSLVPLSTNATRGDKPAFERSKLPTEVADELDARRKYYGYE